MYGRIGKALRFEEDNEYIQITNYKGVTGTKARTISAWAKTTGREGEFVSWGFDDFGQMFIFGIIRRSGVGITPNGGYLYSGWKVNDDNWHHVAVVVDDVELPNLHDDVRLYQDGKLAEIHDIGLLDLWSINTGNDLDVRIGRRFKGLIDDVRIYDRPLSE
ncbi:MAG: LamG-like jellyroll fold domain-containing protein, partial [Planctomycetota bacterium]